MTARAVESQRFEALSVAGLPRRLGGLATLRERLGFDPDTWVVREIGDGNLNQVFVVAGPSGTLIVKQALPYIRLVGESWPLPLKRAFFEYHALTRQAARDPGMVPAIHFFDEAQALIVMEYLSPHVILRKAWIEGRQLPHVARNLGLFLARTLFRGSDLAMRPADRKADLALFAGNAELCDITETLVFSDPYFVAKLNRHTSPQLDGLVAQMRSDRDLKVEAQRMKQKFAANAEALLHGDLHTGSVMVTDDEARVIDPEFAFYGPMGFDVGMLLANVWMSYFSQSGHEQAGSRRAMRTYLLETAAGIWGEFAEEFTQLWHTERTGMLYEKALFEAQGDSLGAQQGLDATLADIFEDALGFAGVECHRRILGLAHNADFESIEDLDVRASCEAKALKFGRHILVNRSRMAGMAAVNDVARRIEAGSLA